MAFFLIVPSAMIVAIILVHAVGKRLGLQIYYATLIAAGILSFMAVFATTFAAPAVGRKFLFVLAIIISALALLLTLANQFLIRKQRAEEQRFTEEVKAAYAAEIEQNPSKPVENSASPEKFDWGNSDETFPTSRYNEFVEDNPAQIAETQSGDAQSAETQADDEENLPLNDKPLTDAPPDKFTEAPVEKSAPQKNFPLDEIFKPLSQIKPAEADKPVKLPEKSDATENFPLDEVFKPLPEIKPVEADKPIVRQFAKTKRTEFFPLQEAFEPLSVMNLDKLETLQSQSATDENAPETLDEFLDKAYSERERGHIWQAIELYKTALERYRADDYAPFVVIDLGNIYKEEALYSNAVKLYEDALKLPAIQRNDEIKREFAANLNYLRVLLDVLTRRGALSIPLAKLSPEILQEIDTESRKIHIHSAQSK